ncbi:MAG TPA: DUF2846 domain-containing protein [Candidatus Acidoferrales bacterium]|nr:DUF2846 domain-containing protein [Candidatus Acidoferrales bacterium]
MNKAAYLLFASAFLAAPAFAQEQAPAAAETSSAGTTATICFYRAHRFEGAALKPSIFVDETDIARLHNGDAVQVTVSPGAHNLHSNDSSTGIQLDAKAGQTYYVRIDIKAGAFKGHGQVTLIDPQEGKFEFAKQKLSVTKDLSANPPLAAPSANSAATAAPSTATSSAAPAGPGLPGAASAAPAQPAAKPAAQLAPPVQPTMQSMNPQPQSLGDVARQYREKKDKPADQQNPPPQQ